MADTTFDGSCLCGSVHVSVKRDGATAAICHCLHCQRQTASAFSVVLVAPVANVTVSGQLKEYRDENDDGRPVFRLFCPNCGSPVQTRSDALEAARLTIIKAGLMNGGSPEPAMQIFCKRAVDWLSKLPGEQHSDGPPLGG